MVSVHHIHRDALMNKTDFSVKENSSQNTYDLSVGNESVSPFQNILQEALQNYE